MNAKLIGIEYHLPDNCETNEDLLRANPDWEMGKIYAKSGIACRHVALPDETANDLGFWAAQKLLGKQLVKPDEIDFLLCCTQTPDHFLPPNAALLQQRLGLGRHIGAFDINLGCSGYVYGLQVAKCLVQTSQARNVLLVATDTYSKHLHPRDRSVRTLFGDGGAATLIGGADDGPGGIGEFLVGTDGRGAAKLIVPSGAGRLPRSSATAAEQTDKSGCVRSQDNLYMDGAAVYSFAVSTVPRLVSSLLDRCGYTVDDIDWFVYHQANKFMLETLAELSGIPWKKMVVSLEDVGNTVSASIPIALKRYVDGGQIQPGHRMLLVGFGVGYSWAACVATWGG